MKTKFLSPLLIAFISLIVFTTSCKKEETKTTETQNLVLGKWHVKLDLTVRLYSNSSVIDTIDYEIYQRGELILNFLENGKGVFESGGDSGLFYYENTNKTLNIYVDGGYLETEIDKLTSTEMVITDYYKYSGDDFTEKHSRFMER